MGEIEKYNPKKLFEHIDNLEGFDKQTKNELKLQITHADIQVRNEAVKKLSQSQIAQYDLQMIMGELTALNKDGMYIRSEQVIKTGSGEFKIEVKGGDKKLVIPVLAILIIGSLLAIFLVFN